MRVAHFGTFDVDNYGDLLFPLIAEWRLPTFSWIHVSPNGESSGFSDAVHSVPASQLGFGQVDGVIIGGGNIVHLRSSPIPEYKSIKYMAYPSITIGALNLASKKKLPLVINGPSIRNLKFGYLEHLLLGKLFDYSNYSAFRDQVSVDIANNFNASRAELTPDTVLDISRMWPVSDFEKPSRGESGHIAVHVNSRYGGSVTDTANALDQIGQITKSEIRFLPIGPCHGDISYMVDVASQMSTRTRLIHELSLKEFAKNIATSKAYVGSSMHGFITAVSYGVPALLVLNNQPLEKFKGLLSALEAPKHVVCPTWEIAAQRYSNAWTPAAGTREKIYTALDCHWVKLENALRQPRNSKANLGFGFLKYWLPLARLSQIEVNFRKAGPWLLRKLTSR
ncbi:polysaccharide pyruvyl transferase family protein [Methylovorus glucosotrophus]|uniref:Polysaccharide pyruvyl transferase domain-containing protein n=1 Tax=Methylovorus glucosotrophus (strain SIP3-4) TaxID=582744 RepID=C6X8A7_METGS|nr:polysaccharide pyruvyl transferase family protein [Methylovorus glucosotrophus]ACT49377.1 hypothetical protein Msip34_0128 [Methylovorus glucosotrophus SIP3-4]